MRNLHIALCFVFYIILLSYKFKKQVRQGAPHIGGDDVLGVHQGHNAGATKYNDAYWIYTLAKKGD